MASNEAQSAMHTGKGHAASAAAMLYSEYLSSWMQRVVLLSAVRQVVCCIPPAPGLVHKRNRDDACQWVWHGVA